MPTSSGLEPTNKDYIAILTRDLSLFSQCSSVDIIDPVVGLASVEQKFNTRGGGPSPWSGFLAFLDVCVMGQRRGNREQCQSLTVSVAGQRQGNLDESQSPAEGVGGGNARATGTSVGTLPRLGLRLSN